MVAWQWHRLNPTDVAKLYATNRAARARTAFDGLVEMMFASAESLCGWLSGSDRSDDISLFQMLNTLKGPSDPCRCLRGQIRRKLGATNKVMNLVHTSDNCMQSVRECLALFGSLELAESSHACGRQLLESVRQRSAGLPISALEVTLLLKEQLALRIATPMPDLENLLMQERKLLADESDRVSAGRSVEANHERQIQALSTQHGFVTLFEELCAVGLQKRRHSGLVDQLRGTGIGLDAWQKLVLECGGSPL